MSMKLSHELSTDTSWADGTDLESDNLGLNIGLMVT